jgi:hypothetical protein
VVTICPTAAGVNDESRALHQFIDVVAAKKYTPRATPDGFTILSERRSSMKVKTNVKAGDGGLPSDPIPR